MLRLQKLLAVGFASVLMLSPLSALADSVLVPRIGFPTAAPKVIYVELTNTDNLTQGEKEQRKIEKQIADSYKEKQKALIEQQKQIRERQNQELNAIAQQRFEEYSAKLLSQPKLPKTTYNFTVPRSKRSDNSDRLIPVEKNIHYEDNRSLYTPTPALSTPPQQEESVTVYNGTEPEIVVGADGDLQVLVPGQKVVSKKLSQTQVEKAAKKRDKETLRDQKEVEKLAAKAEKARQRQAEAALKQQQRQVSQEQPATEKKLSRAERKAQKQAEKETESLANGKVPGKKKEIEPKQHKVTAWEFKQDELRKRRDAEYIARRKLRIEQMEALAKTKSVDGTFYLYNLNNDILMFDEALEAQPTTLPSQTPGLAVQFDKAPQAGLYDLAVRGSGHRTDEPIRVSDEIYWDALQPVLQDLGKNHCPPSANKYSIVEQCYRLRVSQSSSQQLVEGGWYSQAADTTKTGVKNTIEIAQLSQMILGLFQINPESYKAIALSGNQYAESRYPDILDEAYWGLQYLLTAQQPNGSLPIGVQQADHKTYEFLSASPESTAYGLMALASGVKAFRSEDLGLSVKLMRSAERAWAYIAVNKAKVSDEALLLAATAMSQVSSDEKFATLAQQLKSKLVIVSPTTALLLGSNVSGLDVQAPADANDSFQRMIPAIIQLSQGQKQATQPLAQWVADLYGYTEIPLSQDPKFQVEASWRDPLQWAATKTGDFATRVGRKFGERGIVGMSNDSVAPERLKAIESKEKIAKDRIQEGYKLLTLSMPQRIELAYALALLNQNILPAGPVAKEKPKKKQYIEPIDTKKGFWPKLI